jgi:molybdopterin-binding protein
MRAAHALLRIASFPCLRAMATLAAHLSQEPTVSITAINVRNQFRGTIKEIIEGPVVSEVDVITRSGDIVTSVITTRSVKDLGLEVGREVVALVKSTEVSIATL